MANMKITPAHYAHIKHAIGAAMKTKDVLARRDAIVRAGKAKDVDMRLRWDMLYIAGLSQWLCDNVYPYADDSHLDTALRSIMRELYGL